MHYQVGQRGYDTAGTSCYVARASRVLGAEFELWRYWVVDEVDGKPGEGRVRLLKIGEFVASGEPMGKIVPRSTAEQTLMPEFAHFGLSKKMRRSA